MNTGLSFVLSILWWLAFSGAVAFALGRTIHEAERREHEDLDSIERYQQARKALRRPPV